MEQLIVELSEEVHNYAEAVVETVRKSLVVLDKDTHRRGRLRSLRRQARLT
jgi:hypothetical protein